MLILILILICRVKGEAMVKNLGEKSEFVEFDIENVKALEAALEGES